MVIAVPHAALTVVADTVAVVADTVPDVAAHFAGVTSMTPGTDIAQIGRSAVHIGALERVVLPIVEATMTDGATRAGEMRRYGRELSTALHWLDRHLTGDVRVVRSSNYDLTQGVRVATATYIRAEQSLMRALAGVLDGHEIVNLITSYHRASLMAPTRGHPRLSYRGRRGWLMFKVAAFVDDVRDGTDNRAVRSDVWSAADKALHDVDALHCRWRALPPAA